jgi:hypothetical protein
VLKKSEKQNSLERATTKLLSGEDQKLSKKER